MEKLCDSFKPPMPNYVKGTAFHYFRRFYLNNSVMDFHPKEILVTAKETTDDWTVDNPREVWLDGYCAQLALVAT